MPPVDARNRDVLLRRALLALDRGDPELATRFLALLPDDPDVADLRARAAGAAASRGEATRRLRDLRYQFGLNTSWRRGIAYLAAAWFALFGAWELVKAAPVGFASGWATTITTQVNLGSRHASNMVDYTRAVWCDAVYGLAVSAIGVLLAAFVRRASRGATDWEELDVTDDAGGADNPLRGFDRW